MIHHEPVRSAFSESDSILPHVMISTGSPIPRKLSVDSATIAERIFMTTMNMMVLMKLGARCFIMMCMKLPPIMREIRTYSESRIFRTSVRTIFFFFFYPVIPIIMDIPMTFRWPITACMKMISSSEGMLSRISENRIMMLSTVLPASPLMLP